MKTKKMSELIMEEEANGNISLNEESKRYIGAVVETARQAIQKATDHV